MGKSAWNWGMIFQLRDDPLDWNVGTLLAPQITTLVTNILEDLVNLVPSEQGQAQSQHSQTQPSDHHKAI